MEKGNVKDLHMIGKRTCKGSKTCIKEPIQDKKNNDLGFSKSLSRLSTIPTKGPIEYTKLVC